MKCSICKKKVSAVSDELWGRCQPCAKTWLEDIAIPHAWTESITPGLVAFAGIKTPYKQIISDIKNRKIHQARMQGKMVPEMMK